MARAITSTVIPTIITASTSIIMMKGIATCSDSMRSRNTSRAKAAPRVILFNKPFNVLCQFTSPDGRATLADFISVPGVYAAGRLDYDSEGLLVLTDNGRLQQRIADPRHQLEKTYWAQVEGEPTDAALEPLRHGVELRDGLTRPAQ